MDDKVDVMMMGVIFRLCCVPEIWMEYSISDSCKHPNSNSCNIGGHVNIVIVFFLSGLMNGSKHSSSVQVLSLYSVIIDVILLFN